MLDKNEKSPLTLLVHAKITAFDWGKVVVDLFKAQAIKKKLPLSVVYHPQDVKDFHAPIIVFGVDSEWLQNVFDYFAPHKTQILLLCGATGKTYENVSYITIDQQMLVKKCIRLLSDCNRTKPAFFGAQKNDTSDAIKAYTFSTFFPQSDVYSVDDSVEVTCNRLLENVENYDSVICANDVMAIYLLMRCREKKIEIPEKLFLIGNGNLWLSAHVTPSLTTLVSDAEATVELALQMRKSICKFPACAPLNVYISGDVLPRESTAHFNKTESFQDQKRNSRPQHTAVYPPHSLYPCLAQICNLDEALSCLSEEKKTMLRLIRQGSSYAEIAEKVFLSEDTIHYHLKKLYKRLGVNTKKAFCALLDSYGIQL